METGPDNLTSPESSSEQLLADVIAFQRLASSDEEHSPAGRDVRERVARTMVALATGLAAARFGGSLAQLGVEAADVGLDAGAGVLRTLPRLQLTGRVEEDRARLRAWVARHVDWMVRGLVRRHGRPLEWWWQATREECWTHYAPLWEQYFLLLPPELAASTWREMRRRFFRLTYREFLRATVPDAPPAVREVLRLVRADVRAWIGVVELPLSESDEPGGSRSRSAAVSGPEADPEAHLLRQELARLVRLCLDRLEEQDPRSGRLDRRLLQLRYLEQRRLGEIVEILRQEGLGRLGSEASVCRRLRRAESRLRALLVEAGVMDRLARPAAAIILPETIAPLPPSGLPLPRATGKLPGSDCLSSVDAVAARYGLLPRELVAGWERHATTCRFCASRLRPGVAAGPVVAWQAAASLPQAERQHLWSQVLCLRPETASRLESGAGPVRIAWVEPPTVDAYQRLVLRGVVPVDQEGAAVAVRIALADGRILELPEIRVGRDGSLSLRVPCGLLPGARVDLGRVRIHIGEVSLRE